MGDEQSNRVVERVANVLAYLGGNPRGARARSRSDENAEPASDATASTDPSDAADPVRPVTDGGADGAPPGESPWTEDDPIVFGEDAGSGQGTALLDAVTDPDADSAPPFGEEEAASEASEPDADPSEAGGVDPERLDELEARIAVLESDHVQLESSITDVARAVAGLHEDATTIGDDVRQLVAVLGGIAIAREGTGSSRSEPADVVAVLDEIDADELAATVAASADATDANETVDAETPDAEAESDGSTMADGVDAASSPQGLAYGNDGETPTESHGKETPANLHEEKDEAPTEFDEEEVPTEFDEEATPDGIHRGAGEPPRTPETPNSDDRGVESASGADVATPSAAGSSETGQPARELVDPRTDAVGARLRQFREGFVDDPTADLPTGNAADEFRFEKVLLPTDGEAAPDLSNAELEKPYLESLPDGYAADAVVLEWLDWLVSAADGETAAQAVVYYESIEWLTADVREDLLGYLDGLGQADVADTVGASADAADATGGEEAVGEPPAALDLQDHLRSLQYVTELASGEVGTDGV